jgi:hypothetical protein
MTEDPYTTNEDDEFETDDCEESDANYFHRVMNRDD